MISRVNVLNFDVFLEEYVNWLRPEFNKPISCEKTLNACYEEFKCYDESHFKEICLMAFRQGSLPPIEWFHDRRREILEREDRELCLFRPMPEVTEAQRAYYVQEMESWVSRMRKEKSW